MPLPFKSDHPILPNNRYSILKRSVNTINSVRRNAQELNETLTFMSDSIKNGYVEQFPVSNQPPEDRELALIHFCSKIQIGITLHGVPSRFRKREVAFMADIESMFHHFQVALENRDYLSLFWFPGNYPSKPLI